MKAIFPILALLSVLGPTMAGETPMSQIVVLDNENLLFGEVTKVEEGWQIRQAVGGDLVLPAKKILAVVKDRQAAFEIVAKRANLRDADERLRLARWCAKHDLTDEAIHQAEIAVKMRDNFKSANQFLNTLQLTKSQVTPTTTATPAIIQAKAETPATSMKVTEVPSVDYNSESFPFFSTRVHAILLNACASCHSKDDTKGFKLVRLTGRTAVSRNLMSSLAQINPNDPAKSPILIKAITPHGTASEAPFKTRNHPAYAALESWVLIARAPEGTTTPVTPVKVEFAEPKKLPDLDKPASKGDKAKPTEVFGATRPAQAPESKKNLPADPFDPEEFNKAPPRKE